MGPAHPRRPHTQGRGHTPQDQQGSVLGGREPASTASTLGKRPCPLTPECLSAKVAAPSTSSLGPHAPLEPAQSCWQMLVHGPNVLPTLACRLFSGASEEGAVLGKLRTEKFQQHAEVMRRAAVLLALDPRAWAGIVAPPALSRELGTHWAAAACSGPRPRRCVVHRPSPVGAAWAPFSERLRGSANMQPGAVGLLPTPPALGQGPGAPKSLSVGGP